MTKTIAQTAAALATHLTTQHGMDVGTMWIPDIRRRGDDEAGPAPENNQIHQLCEVRSRLRWARCPRHAAPSPLSAMLCVCVVVCVRRGTLQDIGTAVRSKVQSNMTQAKVDCDRVEQQIASELAEQKRRRAINGGRWKQQLAILCLALPVLVLLSFCELLRTYNSSLPGSVLQSPLWEALAPQLKDGSGFATVMSGLAAAGLEGHWERVLAFVALFFLFEVYRQFLAWRTRSLPTRDAAGLKRLGEYREVLALIKTKVDNYTTEYIRHAQKEEFKQ